MQRPDFEGAAPPAQGVRELAYGRLARAGLRESARVRR